jgi:hypothetical protein
MPLYVVCTLHSARLRDHPRIDNGALIVAPCLKVWSVGWSRWLHEKMAS